MTSCRFLAGSGEQNWEPLTWCSSWMPQSLTLSKNHHPIRKRTGGSLTMPQPMNAIITSPSLLLPQEEGNWRLWLWRSCPPGRYTLAGTANPPSESDHQHRVGARQPKACSKKTTQIGNISWLALLPRDWARHPLYWWWGKEKAESWFDGGDSGLNDKPSEHDLSDVLQGCLSAEERGQPEFSPVHSQRMFVITMFLFLKQSFPVTLEVWKHNTPLYWWTFLLVWQCAPPSQLWHPGAGIALSRSRMLFL